MLIRLQDGIRLGGGGDIENLNDLADVAITAPTSGQVLAYDGDKWINTTGGGTAGVSSFNGRTGIVTPQAGDYTKSDVGLGNVDNTSDLNKPISTATQNALNLKANASDIPAPYDLPIASVQTLGGIKVGNNLTITADGTLNATGGGGGGGSVDSVSVNGSTPFLPDSNGNVDLDIVAYASNNTMYIAAIEDGDGVIYPND